VKNKGRTEQEIWAEYDRLKALLPSNLTGEQYIEAIRKLTKRLGI